MPVRSNSANRVASAAERKAPARVPRHIEVQRVLRRRIQAGTFTIGDRVLTDKQVMEEFGVGRMTARAAIDALVQDNLVSRKPGQGTFIQDPKQAAREAQGAADAGYRVTIAYRSSTRTQGGFDASYALASIHNALVEMGVRANLLALPDGDSQARQVLAQHLQTRHPDGVVVHNVGDEGLYEAVEHLPATATNMTLLSTLIPVVPDFQEALRQALNHLFALGHQRIGLITEMRHTVQFTHLWTFGFEQGMYDRGNPIRREWLCAPRTIEDLAPGIETMLKGDARPTAILAAGPESVVSAYDVARSRGLVVGRDLSVVGYGHACEYLAMKPPVTYVTYSMEQFGSHHATAMRMRLKGEIPGMSIRKIPVYLVIRESAGPPRDASST